PLARRWNHETSGKQISRHWRRWSRDAHLHTFFCSPKQTPHPFSVLSSPPPSLICPSPSPKKFPATPPTPLNPLATIPRAPRRDTHDAALGPLRRLPQHPRR